MNQNQASPSKIQRGLSKIQSNYIKYMNQITRPKDHNISYREPKRQTKQYNRFQIADPDPAKRKVYESYGKQWMREKNLLAVVVFAGGFGTRINRNDKAKQFIQFQNLEGQKMTLFKNTMQLIGKANQQNQNMVLYIICSRKNSEDVLDQMQSLINFMKVKFPIYICFQPQNNVLDTQGLQSVYTSQMEQGNLKFPAGIGAFKQAELFYSNTQKFTLQKHITQIIKPDLVYCIGTCNVKQKGINFQMIGLVSKNQALCAFQCSYTESSKKQLPVVCIREAENKSAWLVIQQANLEDFTQDKRMLQKLPVWMDNFVFNPKILETSYERSKTDLTHQFNPRILTNDKDQKLQCLISEATISYAILRDKQKCVGYVTSQGNFLKTQAQLQNLALNMLSLSPSKIVKNSVFSPSKKYKGQTL